MKRGNKMEEFRVRTPVGTLCAEILDDGDYPGIFISLEDSDKSPRLDIARTEYKKKEDVLVTHVWGDAGTENPTHDIEHKGIGAFFGRYGNGASAYSIIRGGIIDNGKLFMKRYGICANENGMMCRSMNTSRILAEIINILDAEHITYGRWSGEENNNWFCITEKDCTEICNPYETIAKGIEDRKDFFVEYGILYNGSRILCADENTASLIADILRVLDTRNIQTGKVTALGPYGKYENVSMTWYYCKPF